MSFHADPLELVVGSNEVTLPLMSEAPKRMDSRNPSRPKVVLPVARGKLELKGPIVVENAVTDVVAGFTLPLWEAALIRPKPTLPVLVIVIRTGGRK
jgi:hypothetical protein